MSTPLVQPPPTAVSGSPPPHGSVGAVIAVVAVIAVLGIVAGFIGRLCTGHRVMGHARFDFEGWVEKKCSSCIDGRVDPTPPPRPAEIPAAQPVQEKSQSSSSQS